MDFLPWSLPAHYCELGSQGLVSAVLFVFLLVEMQIIFLKVLLRPSGPCSQIQSLSLVLPPKYGGPPLSATMCVQELRTSSQPVSLSLVFLVPSNIPH